MDNKKNDTYYLERIKSDLEFVISQGELSKALLFFFNVTYYVSKE